MQDQRQFLAAQTFAVAGASKNRGKYGNIVLRALLDSGRKVVPLNPAAEKIEGIDAFRQIGDVPFAVEALSVVTPPDVTREVIRQAIAAGTKYVWMQPGAEDEQASEMARQAGLNVIDDGSCILVALKLRNID